MHEVRLRIRGCGSHVGMIEWGMTRLHIRCYGISTTERKVYRRLRGIMTRQQANLIMSHGYLKKLIDVEFSTEETEAILAANRGLVDDNKGS